jgi:hypothetical protein
VRIFWDRHDETATFTFDDQGNASGWDPPAQPESMDELVMQMLDQHQPFFLTLGLLRVANTLAGASELVQMFPPDTALSHEQAHRHIRAKLIEAHTWDFD